MAAIGFGWLPPEVNSGLMYSGAGAGPMLAAASAWDGLATELHTTAAGYNSVVAGLISDGWMGPASTAMAAAAAPYATWMSVTAARAEQTAAQARAAVAAYEAVFAATVPPPVIAANRAQLVMLVATNVLGQNTPAIAANEAEYAEMWAQDATAMDGYAGASASASVLSPFSQPPRTTNPAAAPEQAAAMNQTAATAVVTHAPALPASSTGSGSLGSQLLTGLQSISGVSSGKDMVSWATFLPQDGSYAASLANSGYALMRALMPAAAAASAASTAGSAAGAAGAAGAGVGGFGGFGGLASAVTGGLGQSGTIGALSVPQAWAAASPATGSVGSTLGGATLAAAHGVNPNPGMLNGMPMLANAGRAAAGGGHTGAMPRFDVRPSVIPMSPAAG